MRDRYYSSELHRFLSLDKDQGDLYRPSTLNPYAYVGNDPINFIDPSGMTAVNLANALKNAIFNEDGSINWGGVLELGKVALSFTPVGWAIDLYDLGKSILEFDWTWGGLADIGLNAVGFLPGIGDFAKGGGKFIKTADAIADGVDLLSDAGKAITKAGGLFLAGKAAKNVGNGAEAFADSSKAAKALNKGSDALDTANDAGKALKNADEVGRSSKNNIIKSVPETFPIIGKKFSVETRKLQHEWKHASDFGVTGDWNKSNAQIYKNAIQDHIQNSTDIYKSRYRGQDVYVFMNSKTGLGAYTDLDGAYIGGWKFTQNQVEFHIRSGIKIQ